MDVFDEEILKFWRSLQKNAVRYIMIGGYAVNLHGYQRFTSDIDIWLEDTLTNRRQLRAALVACDMGDYPMIDRLQFVPGWTDFKLLNGLQLDIVVEMKGLEGYTFSECLQMATLAEIDDVIVPFLHIRQLIENKKVVNRAKDQIDVIELEKIDKLLNSNQPEEKPE